MSCDIQPLLNLMVGEITRLVIGFVHTALFLM